MDPYSTVQYLPSLRKSDVQDVGFAESLLDGRSIGPTTPCNTILYRSDTLRSSWYPLSIISFCRSSIHTLQLVQLNFRRFPTLVAFRKQRSRYWC